MNAPQWGALCTGAVVGYLVMYFLRRMKNFGIASLTSVLALIFAGAAVKFLAQDTTVWPYYAIGVAGGVIAYIILVLWLFRKKQDGDPPVYSVPDKSGSGSGYSSSGPRDIVVKSQDSSGRID